MNKRFTHLMSNSIVVALPSTEWSRNRHWAYFNKSTLPSSINLALFVIFIYCERRNGRWRQSERERERERVCVCVCMCVCVCVWNRNTERWQTISAWLTTRVHWHTHNNNSFNFFPFRSLSLSLSIFLCFSLSLFLSLSLYIFRVIFPSLLTCIHRCMKGRLWTIMIWQCFNSVALSTRPQVAMKEK